MPEDDFPDSLKKLAELFARPVCRKGTEPLRRGVELAVFLDGAGPASLTRSSEGMEVRPIAPKKPDMTFHVPKEALNQLLKAPTEDVGEIGVEILKLMANADATYRIQAKVHIGPFDLLRNGYLGIIPLGGATVMKFLSSKGLTSIGKIKDALGRMRT